MLKRPYFRPLTIVSILLLLFALQSSAQKVNSRKIDSLQVLIDNAPEDTLKAFRMYQLSLQYDYFNSTERVTWLVAAFNLSRTIGYVNGMNLISPRLINLLYHRNMNDLALRYCYEYMGWLTETNDSIGLQKNYNLYANLLSRMDKSREAFVYYNKALDYNTGVGNKKQCAYILSNLAILMRAMGKTDSALYYTDQSIAILKNEDDPSALSNVILGKAEILLANGDTAAALVFAQEALRGYTEINIVLGIVNSESVLGDIALRKNNPQEALVHYSRALVSLDSLQLYDQKKDLCLRISECLGSLGRFSEAYTYQLLYKQYNDSSASETRKNKMTEIEVKYEITRKDNELQEKSAALDHSRNQRNLLLGGIISVLLLLALSLWAFWAKKKSNALLTEQKKLVEIKQKEITDSITYAKDIQAAFMPNEDIFHLIHPNAFIYSKPKDIVSGDFYWFYTISKDGKPGALRHCAVADCTGHGVPGALMSVICSNALNETVVNNNIHQSDKILNETRRIVKRNLKTRKNQERKDGMDIALVSINYETLELWYSGAYNSAWVCRKGVMIELAADKQPVGVFENETNFTQKYLKLENGDIIYLFSDGYADQFGGAYSKKFKYKPFRDLLISISHLPMQEQKEKLADFFKQWKGELEQTDDVCVLGIGV